MIFLPGSLIAGVMGMNFKAELLTHASLFWFVVAGIALICVTTVVLAKVQGWV